MNITRNGKKKQKENIQVFVRIRPLSAAENGGRAFTVVECPSVKEIILHERPNDKYAKKFTFDRVFGPQSTQVDVYNTVVKPLVDEVLAGYNCTVFAYGQTGTGKTFTMQGVSEDPCMQWQTDTSAGLIPRTLSHLFDELGVLEVHEYIVRVSYLEIYNEELFDLLSGTDDTTKIRLYEDSTKKGTLIIHGLEEVTVHNKASVYQILEKGTLKRQTAATLINASSSRSHTVFTITVHIKENTVKGEELLKIGKINLVDLAGSENVAKAGSVDKRAREAGSINQSLLTLGRVITALVERAPHIPYRESKLTRLLQESLGGRMKTSIIATISPASINLEETLSTLDYAHRAKNVTNRPEINQKLFKSALLQDYAEEIQRLKKDLMASRERIGVYLAQENYNEMQNVIGTQAKEIEEKVNHMKAVQGLVEKRTQLFDKLKQNQEEQTAKLQEIKSKLETKKNALMSTSTKLKIIEQERDEQEYLIEQHVSTEKALFSQAKTLLHLADVTTTDASKFHDKICRKKRVEEKNFELGQQCNRNIARLAENIQGDVSSLIDYCKELIEDIQNEINSQMTSHAKEGDETAEYISKIFVDSYKARISKLLNHINNSCVKYHDWLDNRGKEVGRITELGYKSLELASSKTAPQLHDLMNQGIQEVLRILNDDVSKKCDDMMQFCTDAISTMLNSYSEEHEHLIRDVESIKETIERLMDQERKLAEKEEAFSKIMDNTFNYYNELRLESKKNYSETEKTVDSINEHCNKICDQVKSVYNVNTERDNCFRDRMLSDVESAKNHIRNELEKCSTIAEENVACYHSLTQRLQDDVAKLRDNLKQIENTIEINTDELRTTIEKDKDELTLLLTKMDEFVSEMGSEHSNSVKTYQDESSKRSGDLVHQLQTYYVTTENMSGVISDKLDAICDKVNKFFNEELERYVPTGCTPIKKEFKYPRDLHVTSPHERILKRFREARQNCELGKAETVDTLLDNTVVNESPTKS